MHYASFLLDVKRSPNSPKLNVLLGKDGLKDLGVWLGERAMEGWTLVSAQPIGDLPPNGNKDHRDGELLVFLSKP